MDMSAADTSTPHSHSPRLIVSVTHTIPSLLGSLSSACQCPSLTSLLLEELPLVTDRSVVHPQCGLASRCRSLTRLSVSRCRQLTFASLQALSVQSVELLQLDMTMIEDVEAVERARRDSDRGQQWSAAMARLNRRGCRLLRGAQIRPDG
jgi:hypothetical protein